MADVKAGGQEASPASNASRGSSSGASARWQEVDSRRPRPARAQREAAAAAAASAEQARPAANGGAAPLANGHGSGGSASEGGGGGHRRPGPRGPGGYPDRGGFRSADRHRRFDGPPPPRGGPAAPRDMDELRMHMDHARAGTGEVEALVRSSSFQPREAAFTRLIQQCVLRQDWQKALELWGVMRGTPGLRPNTITYSVLIHVCATVGRWEEAEHIFDQQMEATKGDAECAPNCITYSSLLTACVRGKRVDRALHWYDHMSTAGIEADTITYSVLIPACLDAGGVPLSRVLALMEEMHAVGLAASADTYCRILHALGTEGDWQRALETFIACQMAGVPATSETCVALLGALEAASQSLPAAQLVQEFAQTVGPPQLKLCTAALRVFAKTGSAGPALALWEGRMKPAKTLDPAAARLLLEAAEKGGKQEAAAALKADFKALNVAAQPEAQAPAQKAA